MNMKKLTFNHQQHLVIIDKIQDLLKTHQSSVKFNQLQNLLDKHVSDISQLEKKYPQLVNNKSCPEGVTGIINNNLQKYMALKLSLSNITNKFDIPAYRNRHNQLYVEYTEYKNQIKKLQKKVEYISTLAYLESIE